MPVSAALARHRAEMRSPKVQKVISEVEARYGAISLYGSDPSEEHGTGFKLTGIPATFSVHTQEGTLPEDLYDVQIEGAPPGNYIYADVVSLNTLLECIERMRGPEENWP